MSRNKLKNLLDIKINRVDLNQRPTGACKGFININGWYEKTYMYFFGYVKPFYELHDRILLFRAVGNPFPTDFTPSY